MVRLKSVKLSTSSLIAFYSIFCLYYLPRMF